MRPRPAPPAACPSPRLLLVALPLAGGLAVVVVAGAAWWLWSQRPVTEEATAVAAPTGTTAGAAVVTALQAQAGPVAEPVRLLVARGWADRVRDTPQALVEATGHAEAAVARSPDDVEALTLLAALYSQRGVAPERVAGLLERAAWLAPEAPFVLAAGAEQALARGDVAAARAGVGACLAAAPEDLVCLELQDRLAEGPLPERRRAAAALGERWPDHAGIALRVAARAAEAGDADAGSVAEAALARFPRHPGIVGLRARQRLAAGDVAGAGGLAHGLGADAPPDLVADLAGAALQAGDAAGALRWVDTVPDVGTDAQRAAIRLRRAQARVLQAEADPADPAKARAAVEAAVSALELGRGDPAAVQAQLLAARLAGDFAAGQRAFERLETAGASPRELAAVYLARVRLDVAQGVPAPAQRWMDEAVRLDPGSAEGWLAAADLAVQGQNAAAALGALRRAVASVDRRPAAGVRTLPVVVDVPALTNGLVNLVGSDAVYAQDLTLGLAVLDWLGGQPDRAAARVASAAGGSDDATLHALRARLLHERGDQLGAAEAIARARALDGRTPAWAELARTIEGG